MIEALDLEIHNGLNVFTGETGAGKSIIIDALGLVLGQKAAQGLVRKGAQECQITGEFELKKNKPAKAILEFLGLESETRDSLIVRRQIDAQGKSRIFVNDNTVNLNTLAQLAQELVEVHGQHENQKLLKPGQQRELLDRFGDCAELRDEIKTLYEEWKQLKQKREADQVTEQEKNRKIDLYQFQVKEIDDAALVPGEEEELEKSLPELKNAERLREIGEELFAELYESEGSVSERLDKAQKKLEQIQSLGVELLEVQTFLEESRTRIEESVKMVQSFKERLVSDPRKLDAVITRQDQIERLKKKYGRAIPQILEYREQIGRELQTLENLEESLLKQDEEIAAAYARLLKQCKKLTQARKKSSEKLEQQVTCQLQELGFNHARFSIAFYPEKDQAGKELPTAEGLERIEFLFSANPGEDLHLLKEVASGGELSRVMLALKSILARADAVPTLIFDEIDAGVGGSMGTVVGEKLKVLSQLHQILVITHLPQIAAFGDFHLRVQKQVLEGRTSTSVDPLEKETRIQEIARMLGGSSNGKQTAGTAQKHAIELLKRAK